ncbi:hypothetical protein ABCX51_002372 [Salmonella enterica]
MTALNKQSLRLRKELSNPAIGSKDHLRKLALSLLDELVAKDKSIGFLKDQLAQLANFNPDWDRLEAATDSLREHMAKLSDAEKRIAELEARTVTVQLPADNAAESESPEDDATAWFDEGWNARGKADKEALIAAGIGVKGE